MNNLTNMGNNITSVGIMALTGLTYFIYAELETTDESFSFTSYSTKIVATFPH